MDVSLLMPRGIAEIGMRVAYGDYFPPRRPLAFDRGVPSDRESGPSRYQ
jgi:hypothetical protein